MTSTLEKPQMQDAQTPEHSQKQDAEMQEQPQTHDNEPQDEQREEQTTTEQNENNGTDVETNAPVFDEQQEENNEEETPQENETNVETPVETADHEEDQIAETPQEKSVATPATQKTVTQVPASTSATKRKFDALHARNLALEPSISEHEKNKKARASALMKSPATKSETKCGGEEGAFVQDDRKTHRTPVKYRMRSPVTKDMNRSAFKEKVKDQRLVAQQDARVTPFQRMPHPWR
ncbi:hypothetical protein KRP22_003607 [Phytophthora ramorum]|nr:hypothetical protein KRP22_9541 [Phytophthora ramorum]